MHSSTAICLLVLKVFISAIHAVPVQDPYRSSSSGPIKPPTDCGGTDNWSPRPRGSAYPYGVFGTNSSGTTDGGYSVAVVDLITFGDGTHASNPKDQNSTCVVPANAQNAQVIPCSGGAWSVTVTISASSKSIKISHVVQYNDGSKRERYFYDNSPSPPPNSECRQGLVAAFESQISSNSVAADTVSGPPITLSTTPSLSSGSQSAGGTASNSTTSTTTASRSTSAATSSTRSATAAAIPIIS